MNEQLYALERAIRLALNATMASDNFAAARFVQYSAKAQRLLVQMNTRDRRVARRALDVTLRRGELTFLPRT
jgi:hypothetical protein